MKVNLDAQRLHDLNSALTRLELFISGLKAVDHGNAEVEFEELRESARSAVTTLKTHILETTAYDSKHRGL